ncbi:hypothetical protein L596_028719 [Steinernema carpocapsae]|uniref:Uncharacterized protein n=1 Tax=Steinernema carpocapsae TaxID=34508 RepID=A0A4U5LZ77_STECR|nr:hypothetical protein L596_028719 [Steinernema carpocapsae]
MRGDPKKGLTRHVRLTQPLTRQKRLVQGVRGAGDRSISDTGHLGRSAANDRSVSRHLLVKPTGRSQRMSLK